MSERYDQASTDRPAKDSIKNLIICSAPRTGSNELCRFLHAAGIGIPLEYFNPLWMPELARRWDALGAAPNSIDIGAYIDALRAKRTAGGVFAFKLQYPQFESFLRNPHGETLFEDAVVVHLFRADAVAQFASFSAAQASGKWDYGDVRTTAPAELSGLTPVQLRNMMEELLMGDAQFRILFTMLGIRPIFLLMDDLFAQPQATVRRIAEELGASVDEARLSDVLAASKRYDHAGKSASSSVDLGNIFKPIVFRQA